MLEIKIGEFVKEHRENIIELCQKDLNEFNNLKDKDYSKKTFKLSYPLLSTEKNNYWKDKDYRIENEKYRFCSEFGGSHIINDITRTERDGNLFLKYLEDKNLLLSKYKDEEIKFIVGKNKETPTKEDKTKISSYNIKNIILYGVAGVGKTHNTNKLISLIESAKDEKEIFETIKENENSDSVDISDIKDRVKFITFHQSFGYEDFIEGFRPNEDGEIKLVNGIFKDITLEAIENKAKNYYLIVDEINRGNISKIFGELITLIEESKRDDLEVVLPYSKEPFRVPSNLYIIGTMNSSDKSIALIDIALRRRFTFLKMKPKDELVPQSSRELFKKLNEYILETLGEDYLIGHSYFMGGSDLDFVLEYQIKPLLEEYFYGDSEGLKRALEIIEEIR